MNKAFNAFCIVLILIAVAIIPYAIATQVIYPTYRIEQR